MTTRLLVLAQFTFALEVTKEIPAVSTQSQHNPHLQMTYPRSPTAARASARSA